MCTYASRAWFLQSTNNKREGGKEVWCQMSRFRRPHRVRWLNILIHAAEYMGLHRTTPGIFCRRWMTSLLATICGVDHCPKILSDKVPGMSTAHEPFRRGQTHSLLACRGVDKTISGVSKTASVAISSLPSAISWRAFGHRWKQIRIAQPLSIPFSHLDLLLLVKPLLIESPGRCQ